MTEQFIASDRFLLKKILTISLISSKFSQLYTAAAVKQYS